MTPSDPKDLAEIVRQVNTVLVQLEKMGLRFSGALDLADVLKELPPLLASLK